MQRSMADAILKSYRENAEPNLPEGLPRDTKVPLLVDFRLGDLLSLKRSIEETDRMKPYANRA
jgi:hypothetical protein